jgi:hypothetical protein
MHSIPTLKRIEGIHAGKKDVQPPGVMALLEEARGKITGMEELVIEIARRAYSLGVKDGAREERKVGGMTTGCESCGAWIFWAVTEAGKRIPLDSSETKDGNIVVEFSREKNQYIAHVLKKDEVPQPLSGSWASARFTSHFATCPNAAKHRKKKS